jgi:hypothetical protein
LTSENESNRYILYSQNKNKNAAGYVGFEYSTVISSPQPLFVYCLFSGGLPSPLPTYNPPATNATNPGSGPIAMLYPKSPSPFVDERCYAFNAATGAPTKPHVTQASSRYQRSCNGRCHHELLVGGYILRASPLVL